MTTTPPEKPAGPHPAKGPWPSKKTADPTRQLTAQDRCDRCSAPAVVATGHVHDTVDDDGTPGTAVTPLMWCQHHYREHEPALEATNATMLVDDREWAAWAEAKRNRPGGT